ncbi:MAG: hypothetical protein HC817_07750 [Saprospiraceae bacterium]|nr:hypothetical protein [Saprospiraceae bacterium]
MKKYILGLFAISMFTSCDPDPELDPLQFSNVKTGSMLALRGESFKRVSEDALFDLYLGAVDSFSVSGTNANRTFTFESEFISRDITSLSKVLVYAFKKGQARALVATIDGGIFQVKSGSNYPYGKITIPFAEVLSATKTKASDFKVGDYIEVELDLELKDGTKVPASSMINNRLTTVAIFFLLIV